MLRYTFLLLLITLQFSIQKALDSRECVCGEGDRLKGVGGEGKWGRKVSFPNPQQLNTLRVDHWKNSAVGYIRTSVV